MISYADVLRPAWEVFAPYIFHKSSEVRAVPIHTSLNEAFVISAVYPPVWSVDQLIFELIFFVLWRKNVYLCSFGGPE